MRISSLLLKPYIATLQKQFQSLQQNLAFQDVAPARELSLQVRDEMKSLEKLLNQVDLYSQENRDVVPGSIHDSLKRSKLNLRFAQRTWQRLVSNESRIRKMKEKRTHVTTFAA